MKQIGGYRKKGEVRDLTGQKFFRLTALYVVGRSSLGRTKWLCKCDCGNTREVTVDNLTRNHTKSCGCFRSEQASVKPITHGLTYNKFYSRWNNMMRRCYDLKNNAYPDYGGRGIVVCERWHDIQKCYQDLGDPPTDQHSIERCNNDGNYSPENCRWATKQQQANNRRSNVKILWDGREQTLAQWARELGFKFDTLWRRLNFSKMTIEDAFTRPVRKWGNKCG